MYIKQISVFLENAKGSLYKLTRLLGERGVDLVALSIADTEHYGILRCIVNDVDKGVEALKEAGYTVKLTDVLAVCVEDKPGGLADTLKILETADISVEYLYAFVRNNGASAVVIMHLSDLEKGREALLASGCPLLTQKEVCAL